ncbi:phage tail assembly protein T [Tautonia plasticadhaerens]|uniref:Minor tail T domain-containing protein n=1 Tax=Tautonia plasticadhaerens TaxID=2527974 RepID=A0A518GZK7_9BACT|nr:hypothetical protein [Tautonia plasticadhaerens]QDV34012.1 hypothetical protein ElP_18930 [Tautonia plasticadhaerens]
MLLFRLALHFGEPDPDALAERISSPLLSEWLAFFRLHPLPDPWLQTGITCDTLVRVLGTGKAARRITPDSFIPRPRRRAPQAPGAMRAALAAFARLQSPDPR